MIGRTVGVEPTKSDPEGLTGLECYFLLDSQGKRVPCQDQESLDKVMRGKKSWNLQIKMWAEDFFDLIQPPELREYCQGLPPWIEKAVWTQALRNRRTK